MKDKELVDLLGNEFDELESACGKHKAVVFKFLEGVEGLLPQLDFEEEGPEVKEPEAIDPNDVKRLFQEHLSDLDSETLGAIFASLMVLGFSIDFDTFECKFTDLTPILEFLRDEDAVMGYDPLGDLSDENAELLGLYEAVGKEIDNAMHEVPMSEIDDPLADDDYCDGEDDGNDPWREDY